MKKYVYKITNEINGKIYIGQTNNIKRRMQEHKHDKRKNTHLHRAIKLYGWENFSVETLYYGEDYNREEKRWIVYYESRNPEKGYNIVEGGQDSSGESNPASVLTQEEVDAVIELLRNTNNDCKEISHITGVSLKNIYNINSGAAWIKDELNYPIRELTHRLSEMELNSIYDLLINTETSYEDIAKMFNIQSYNVCYINLGKAHKKEGYTYPLRDLNIEKKKKAKEIIKLLSETDLQFKDISEITGKSISIISKINLGKSWIDETITYPIRNYK